MDGMIPALAIVIGAALLGALLRCLPHYPRGRTIGARPRLERLYDVEAFAGTGPATTINLFQNFNRFGLGGVRPLPPIRRLECREDRKLYLVEVQGISYLHGPQGPPDLVSEVRGELDWTRSGKVYALVKRPDGRREFVDVTEEANAMRRSAMEIGGLMLAGAIGLVAYMAAREKPTART